MRNGFIFNSGRCVNCKACSAACLLENNWSVSGRNIYTFNSEVLPDLPVTHLSLACNHCKNPLCLDGCPAGAYARDSTTSAVIITSEKCIGCRYCSWNCPYDAPKLNLNKGFIEKCDFCKLRIIEGSEPACTAACPTGALHFGEIPEIISNNDLNWFPEKGIDPALYIISTKNVTPLRIIPDTALNEHKNKPLSAEKNISGEWSLILFSFLTLISVSYSITYFIGNRSTDTVLQIGILILAGLFSLFHLRLKLKAWRAILNFRSSPLSREIILFLIYSGLASAALITGNMTLFMISVFIGLLLLIAIDAVYTYADKSPLLVLHSGQTFLTGLLIGSFLLNALFPFLFIASVKVIFNLYSLIRNRSINIFFTLRIIRVAFLFIISAVMISGNGGNDIVKYIIFLSGEFADRILYYADFYPVNINSEINRNLLSSHNEKERD
ncbi:MAG: hypothetical protein C0408_04135 [Odoribacter sp.]|nr:hypothetical protein [Odoribacter sp.]